jgi:hypothetical protein
MDAKQPAEIQGIVLDGGRLPCVTGSSLGWLEPSAHALASITWIRNWNAVPRSACPGPERREAPRIPVAKAAGLPERSPIQ